MADTKIQWADKVWNPLTGCTKISEGCKNCYAERQSKRFAGRFGYPKDDPFKVTFHPDRLNEPARWRKPQRIFVCSMGDLFHEDVLFSQMAAVWVVILKNPQHTFMMLTKRPANMLEFTHIQSGSLHPMISWPRNAWLGVSVENQRTADERIPILLQIPAAKRFVSVEPMLDWINLKEPLEGYRIEAPLGGWSQTEKPLDWVICGDESGPNRRRCDPDWIRSLRDQCVKADVPFFLKQMEVNGKLLKMPEVNGKLLKMPELDGKVWDQMPEVKS